MKANKVFLVATLLSGCGPSPQEISFIIDCEKYHKPFECQYLWLDAHKEACGASAAAQAGSNAFVGGMIGGMAGGKSK